MARAGDDHGSGHKIYEVEALQGCYFEKADFGFMMNVDAETGEVFFFNKSMARW